MAGSIIMSSEWSSNKELGRLEYDHCANPANGNNIRIVELCRGILKLKILRKLRNTTETE